MAPPAPPPSLTAAVAPSGRPRDPRIDHQVLQATADLVEEVGYLRLTMGAIADRAGTNKPAIYRRWPTKAHVVHEAVFPAADAEVPAGDDLRSEVRALVAVGVQILGRPAARAAMPGLLAEMFTDPELHADVLQRFTDGTWGWLEERIQRGIAAGEVREGVQPSTVLELIAGSVFLASVIRPAAELGPSWVDSVVDVVMRGIEA